MLGPFLFLVFVNDLPNWVENGMCMFADDTKVWRYFARIEDQQSLQEVKFYHANEARARCSAVRRVNNVYSP